MSGCRVLLLLLLLPLMCSCSEGGGGPADLPRSDSDASAPGDLASTECPQPLVLREESGLCGLPAGLCPEAWQMPTGGYGLGLGLGGGAFLNAQSSLLEANHVAGVRAEASPSLAALAGCTVRNTVRAKNGSAANAHNDSAGAGISISDGGELNVLHTLVSDAASSAVSVRDPATTALVRGSALLGTSTAGLSIGWDWEIQTMADGVAVSKDAHAPVVDSVLSGNQRCGLYFLGASGSLEGNLVTGNGSYGLAMGECADKVLYEHEAMNLFLGNCVELPLNMRSEVTDSPGSLPLPEEPTVVPLLGAGAE